MTHHGSFALGKELRRVFHQVNTTSSAVAKGIALDAATVSHQVHFAAAISGESIAAAISGEGVAAVLKGVRHAQGRTGIGSHQHAVNVNRGAGF